MKDSTIAPIREHLAPEERGYSGTLASWRYRPKVRMGSEGGQGSQSNTDYPWQRIVFSLEVGLRRYRDFPQTTRAEVMTP